jgi:transcription antitermination factor NusG
MYSDTVIRADSDCSFLPEHYLRPLWYVVYTSANHEKRVQMQLQERNVESLLPLYEERRRWKDRTKRLQLPVFPGYVFVRLALRDRLQVLRIPGVARLVGFNGDPVPLSESDIAALRTALDRQSILQPHPYLTVGRRVRIKGGPLKGMEGILIRKKNIFRLVVSIPLISRSASVEIDTAYVERID